MFMELENTDCTILCKNLIIKYPNDLKNNNIFECEDLIVSLVRVGLYERAN